MDTQIRRLALAGAVAGFLAVGGVSLASAQEDPTSTTETTVEEETTTTVQDDSAVEDDSSSTDEDSSTAPEGCPRDGSSDTDATAEGSAA